MRTLAKMIGPDRLVRLQGKTKAEVLDELIAVLARAPEVRDAEALRQAILEREAIMSTGIGQGVAVPHARLETVTDFVAAVGLASEGIPFDAFDERPVQIVVMIAGPPRHREYLQILARLMLVLKHEANRRMLLEARSADELVATVRRLEEEGPS